MNENVPLTVPNWYLPIRSNTRWHVRRTFSSLYSATKENYTYEYRFTLRFPYDLVLQVVLPLSELSKF